MEPRAGGAWPRCRAFQKRSVASQARSWNPGNKGPGPDGEERERERGEKGGKGGKGGEGRGEGGEGGRRGEKGGGKGDTESIFWGDNSTQCQRSGIEKGTWHHIPQKRSRAACRC